MTDPGELYVPFGEARLGPGDVPTDPADRPSLADYAAQAQPATGLECPDCGCRDFRVKHTWRLKDGAVRRLRVCRYCGYPITTIETATPPTEEK